LDPSSRTLTRADLFAQDSVSLTERLKVIVGVKLEKDAYVSLEPLPSLRVSWKVTDSDLLWAAVSRAVRAPSRIDRDLFQSILVPGARIDLLGGGDFQSEQLIAYEVGYRGEPLSRLSFSASFFYNDYRDLRSLEPTPGTVTPLVFGNEMEGSAYGVEFWASYAVADWWLLSAGLNLLHKDLRYAPGSSRLGGLESAGNDPGHQVSIRSSMNLSSALTLDADVRVIGSLPNPAVPAYTELNARLGWSITPSCDVSLSGLNLLHAQHVEYVVVPTTVEVGRSFLVDARWRF
jgi:iron complex outermembrane receptor protein